MPLNIQTPNRAPREDIENLFNRLPQPEDYKRLIKLREHLDDHKLNHQDLERIIWMRHEFGEDEGLTGSSMAENSLVSSAIQQIDWEHTDKDIKKELIQNCLMTTHQRWGAIGETALLMNESVQFNKSEFNELFFKESSGELTAERELRLKTKLLSYKRHHDAAWYKKHEEYRCSESFVDRLIKEVITRPAVRTLNYDSKRMLISVASWMTASNIELSQSQMEDLSKYDPKHQNKAKRYFFSIAPKPKTMSLEHLTKIRGDFIIEQTKLLQKDWPVDEEAVAHKVCEIDKASHKNMILESILGFLEAAISRGAIDSHLKNGDRLKNWLTKAPEGLQQHLVQKIVEHLPAQTVNETIREYVGGVRKDYKISHLLINHKKTKLESQTRSLVIRRLINHASADDLKTATNLIAKDYKHLKEQDWLFIFSSPYAESIQEFIVQKCSNRKHFKMDALLAGALILVNQESNIQSLMLENEKFRIEKPVLELMEFTKSLIRHRGDGSAAKINEFIKSKSEIHLYIKKIKLLDLSFDFENKLARWPEGLSLRLENNRKILEQAIGNRRLKLERDDLIKVFSEPAKLTQKGVFL